MSIVDLTAVKAQLRIDGDHENAALEGLILAAASHIEQNYRLVAVRRTENFALDRFGRMVTVPVRPVVPGSVLITYLDAAGVEQPVDDIREIVLDGWTRVLPAIGDRFPYAACEPGAVRISAAVGFDEDQSIDPCAGALRIAMLVMIAALYEDREAATEPATIGLMLDGFGLKRV